MYGEEWMPNELAAAGAGTDRAVDDDDMYGELRLQLLRILKPEQGVSGLQVVGHGLSRL